MWTLTTCAVRLVHVRIHALVLGLSGNRINVVLCPQNEFIKIGFLSDDEFCVIPLNFFLFVSSFRILPKIFLVYFPIMKFSKVNMISLLNHPLNYLPILLIQKASSILMSNKIHVTYFKFLASKLLACIFINTSEIRWLP